MSIHERATGALRSAGKMFSINRCLNLDLNATCAEAVDWFNLSATAPMGVLTTLIRLRRRDKRFSCAK